MKFFFISLLFNTEIFSGSVPLPWLDKMADVFRMTQLLTWLDWNQTKTLPHLNTVKFYKQWLQTSTSKNYSLTAYDISTTFLATTDKV